MSVCLNLCCTLRDDCMCYLRCEKDDGSFDRVLQLCSVLKIGTEFEPKSPYTIELFPSSLAGITFGQVVLPMTYTGISCLPFAGRTLINFQVKFEKVCENPSALYTFQRLILCSVGQIVGETEVERLKINPSIAKPFHKKWTKIFQAGWRCEGTRNALQFVTYGQ